MIVVETSEGKCKLNRPREKWYYKSMSAIR